MKSSNFAFRDRIRVTFRKIGVGSPKGVELKFATIQSFAEVVIFRLTLPPELNQQSVPSEVEDRAHGQRDTVG